MILYFISNIEVGIPKRHFISNIVTITLKPK